MTQKDLAEPSYTAAYVSTIEAGKRIPSQDANNHFAARLGIDPDELYTGRGPRLRALLESILHDARVAYASGRRGKAERLLEQIEREGHAAGMPRLTSRA